MGPKELIVLDVVAAMADEGTVLPKRLTDIAKDGGEVWLVGAKADGDTFVAELVLKPSVPLTYLKINLPIAAINPTSADSDPKAQINPAEES